ncbi:MAG TPA: hypothetical protein VHH12_05800, partial [Mycobacterium sp.]|nr:hypothetical protein [Mycobacterium sp.]
TLAAWGRQGRRAGGSIRQLSVNAQPGALVLDSQGHVVGVMSLDIADGQIVGIRSVINPDKLRHIGAVGDVTAIVRAGGG